MIDAIHPVGVFVKSVIRHFVTYPKRCNGKTGKSHRQPNDAYQRLVFVFPQIAESDF
jgi:hypothetical protein